MPTRHTFVSATLDGTPFGHIKSASCTYSWKRVPEATVYVSVDPSPGTPLYNAELELTIGAGAHNVVCFRGLFRHYTRALWPRSLGLVFRGYSVRLAEYQNRDDPLHAGGLTLLDLVGSPTSTDADIVAAVLDRVGVAYTGANIDGTGSTFGSRAPAGTFIWRAGTSTNPLTPLYGAGQTAESYLQDWDKASAVYTDPSSPVGFLRLYETPNGIYRALIGGRPRGTPALTFSEGVDLSINSVSDRDYPAANAVFVSGFDPGLGIGVIRNVDAAGAFLGQSSNPYQSSGQPFTQDYSSPFIEWNNELDGGIGMNAERVGNALLADLNRETVTVRFRTPRDEFVTPGMTILVQGPGGAPDRLGVGENLWVDEVTRGIAEDGEFYQEIAATGGGSPDDNTPAPPG